jgi:hypothetical protein
VGEIGHDGFLQFGDAFEGAATDALSRDLGEEAFAMLSQEAEVGVKCR